MTLPASAPQQRAAPLHFKHLFLLALICLLAFGLRVYDLDGQSMWSDEGLSYYRARLTTDQVLANTITVDGVHTIDTNPPFYFLLLHGWRALFGETVFMLRLMGVFAALLAIPLMHVLGRALFGRRAGTLAALFLAVSPFHVWQTQVLRNYGLLITLNLFCVYGLVRALDPGGGTRRGRWAALWLGAGLLGIYTHYFGFFIFAFTCAAFIVHLLWSRRLRLARGTVLALVLIAALLLPALWSAFMRFRAGRQFDFFMVEPLGIVRQALSVFSVGMSPTLTHPWFWTVPGLILLVGGLLLAWRLRRRAALLLLGYQVLPLALLLALSTINPLINGTRHLLIGLPPFLLLGAALPWLQRRGHTTFTRLALFVALIFVTIQVVWLQRQFQHNDFVRDDVRAAARYLNQMAEPDDTIVLHDTLIQFTFDAYYEGAAPVIASPLYGRLDEEEAIGRLQTAASQSRRIWFLTHPEPRTGFPRERLLRWADEHWRRLNTIDFEWLWLPLRLRAYEVQPEVESLPSQATPKQASYENGLTMHGFQMPDSVRSGDPFAVRYYFSRHNVPASSVDANYEISLRFLDEHGRLWRQIDQGLWPTFPLHKWPVETMLRYDHITRLPAGLPPGDYQVWMRVVNREQDRNVSLTGGGVDLKLTDISVEPASCDAENLGAHFVRESALFGGSLLLKGYTEPAGQYLPGHLLTIDLLWCILRPPAEAPSARIELLDGEGVIVAHGVNALTRASHPSSAWEGDQLLQGTVDLLVPSTLRAGEYDLRLSLVDDQNEATMFVNLGLGGRSVDLGQITIREWDLETVFPPIATPLRADFGDPPLFELHGYKLDTDTLAPGESTTLTLYWRSVVDSPPVSYSIFVHVGEEGSAPEAQADGLPLNGFRPTSSWRAGEIFVDERTLLIPEDAAEGQYQLRVGFYVPESNARLPVFAQGQGREQDAAMLQAFTITR